MRRSSGLPSVTVTGGVGQSMGWLGVRGTDKLRSARFSVFGALGYCQSLNQGILCLAFAGGVRVFTSGASIAAFLRSLFSPITTNLPA